jgi:hypothetical protein
MFLPITSEIDTGLFAHCQSGQLGSLIAVADATVILAP